MLYNSPLLLSPLYPNLTGEAAQPFLFFKESHGKKGKRAESNILRLEVIKFLLKQILLLSSACNELFSAFYAVVIVSPKNLIKHCWILLIIINRSDNGITWRFSVEAANLKHYDR